LSQAPPPDTASLQERLGIRFEVPQLWAEALVHPSYLNENPDFGLPSYQRLEFLGDAVLGLLVGEALFRRFPELSEGPLTQLRATFVQRATLAAWAESLDLGTMMVMGRGEERSGGRKRARNLAAVMEAVIAALYLDRGLEKTRAIVEEWVERTLTSKPGQQFDPDPKSALQERLQATKHESPRYEVVSEDGPPHARRYLVAVSAAGEVLGQGEGTSKRRAEEEAARDALRKAEGQVA
jgi:ribonuclease-3